MRWWNLLLRATAAAIARKRFSSTKQRKKQPAAVGSGRGRHFTSSNASRSAHLAQQIDLVAHMVVQLGVAWEAAIQRGKGRLLFEHAQQHAPAFFANGHACYNFVLKNGRLIEAAIQDMKLDLTGLLCAEAKVGAGWSKREVDMLDAIKRAAAQHVDTWLTLSLAQGCYVPKRSMGCGQDAFAPRVPFPRVCRSRLRAAFAQGSHPQLRSRVDWKFCSAGIAEPLYAKHGVCSRRPCGYHPRRAHEELTHAGGRERARGDHMVTREPHSRARKAEPEDSAAEHKPA
jgi:hypothetical protein